MQFESFSGLVAVLTFAASALLTSTVITGCGGDDGTNYGGDYSGNGGDQPSDQPPSGACALPAVVSVWAGEALSGTLFLSAYADGYDQPRQFKGEAVAGGFGRDIKGFKVGDCGPLVLVLVTQGDIVFDSSQNVKFYEGDQNALEILYGQKYGSNATPDLESGTYAEIVHFWLTCYSGDLSCDQSLLPGGTFLHRQTADNFDDYNVSAGELRVWVIYSAP